MSKCIIVLGPDYLSNSIFAGVLNILGINFGKSLQQSRNNNPEGFIKNKKITRINENILESLNSSYDDIRPLQEKWWQKSYVNNHKKEAISIIEKEFKGPVMFAIKDPRLSRLLPLWIEIFSEIKLIPNVVITIRNPSEFAYSLEKRNGFSTEKSMNLWMTHMLDAEYYSREFPRTFLTFDRLVSDPEKSIHQISERLTIQFPLAYEDVKSDVENFLEPALEHHKYKTSEKNTLMSKLIFDYYELLKGASQKSALITDDLSRIDNIRTEFGEIRSFFYNHELEEAQKRLKNHVHDLEMTQAILKKQIEDHIGLLYWRDSEIENLEQKVGAQSARLGELYKLNRDLQKINSELRKINSELREDLDIIFASRSWKITKPLRWISKRIRGY